MVGDEPTYVDVWCKPQVVRLFESLWKLQVFRVEFHGANLAIERIDHDVVL